MDDAQAEETIRAAWDAGVRHFDTAPHYGLGLAELRLGRVLREHSRDQFIVSTKVGKLLVPSPESIDQLDNEEGFVVARSHTRVYDYSRDGVLRSLDSSLQRLGLDHVDIVYVHDPDDHYAEALDGAFPALDELRSQGTISSYGAGMNQSAMLADFVRNTSLDIVMLAGRYSLLDQSAALDLIPVARERNVSIVAAGVFNSGLLARPRPTASSTFDYQPASSAMLARANAIADVAAIFGLTLPEVAVQFALLNPMVASVCLGARSGVQVDENARLFGIEVPPELWAKLTQDGLMGPG